MSTPVTVTLDQAKELGRPLTMADSLILIECRPRKKAQEVEYIDFEPVERKEFEPWNGKNPPPFEVETPCDGRI